MPNEIVPVPTNLPDKTQASGGMTTRPQPLKTADAIVTHSGASGTAAQLASQHFEASIIRSTARDTLTIKQILGTQPQADEKTSSTETLYEKIRRAQKEAEEQGQQNAQHAPETPSSKKEITLEEALLMAKVLGGYGQDPELTRLIIKLAKALYRDRLEELQRYILFTETPVPIRERKEKPDQTKIPHTILPLPVIVAPSLHLEEPLDSQHNKDMLQLMYLWTTKTFDQPETLQDLLDRIDLLERTGMLEKSDTKVVRLQNHLQNIHDYLRTNDTFLPSEQRLTEITNGSNFSYALSEVLSFLDNFPRQIDQLAKKYAPPPVLREVATGRISLHGGEGSPLENLAYFAAHLVDIDAEQKEIQAYQKRQTEYPAGTSLLERLRISVQEMPYRDVHTAEECYPPLISAERLYHLQPAILCDQAQHFLAAFPPLKVRQAISAIQASLYPPDNPPLPVIEYPIDINILTLPKQLEEMTAEPQKLLEHFLAGSERMAYAYTYELPTLYHLYAQTLIGGGPVDYQHYPSQMVGWLRAGGLRKYLELKTGILQAQEEDRPYYRFDQEDPWFQKAEYNLDLVPGTECYMDIGQAISLITRSEENVLIARDESENTFFELGKLFHPDYSYATINNYPSISGKILNELKQRGIVSEKEKHWVVNPGQPQFISFRFLAQLAGITDELKAQQFCQILKEMTIHKPESADYKVNTYEHYPCYTDLDLLQKGLTEFSDPEKSPLVALWFVPLEISPYAKTERVLDTNGTIIERTITQEGGLDQYDFRMRDAIARLNLLSEGAIEHSDHSLLAFWRLADASKGAITPQRIIEDRLASLGPRLEQTERDIHYHHLYVHSICFQHGVLDTEEGAVGKLLTQLKKEEALDYFNLDHHLQALDKAKKTKQIMTVALDTWKGYLSELPPSVNHYERGALPPEMVSEVRGIVSAFGLSVLSLPSGMDKDITGLCDENEIKKYSLVGGGRPIVTAKSMAYLRLTQALSTLDEFSGKQIGWSDIDIVLSEVESTLDVLEIFLHNPDIPSYSGYDSIPALMEPTDWIKPQYSQIYEILQTLLHKKLYNLSVYPGYHPEAIPRELEEALALEASGKLGASRVVTPTAHYDAEAVLIEFLRSLHPEELLEFRTAVVSELQNMEQTKSKRSWMALPGTHKVISVDTEALKTLLIDINSLIPVY